VRIVGTGRETRRQRAGPTLARREHLRPDARARQHDGVRGAILGVPHGPAPPSGTHRFGFFVFEQPGEFEQPAYGDNITKWDYEAYLAASGTKEPVSSNWILVHHDA